MNDLDWTQVILTLITVVIGPLVVMIGAALLKKLGVDANTKRLELIAELATGAVNYAEQWRRRENADGRTPTSHDMLREATTWFARNSKSRGLGEMLTRDFQDFIEMKLGEKNAAKERRAVPLKLSVASVPPTAGVSELAVDDTRPTPVPEPEA